MKCIIYRKNYTITLFMITLHILYIIIIKILYVLYSHSKIFIPFGTSGWDSSAGGNYKIIPTKYNSIKIIKLK